MLPPSVSKVTRSTSVETTTFSCWAAAAGALPGTAPGVAAALAVVVAGTLLALTAGAAGVPGVAEAGALAVWAGLVGKKVAGRPL